MTPRLRLAYRPGDRVPGRPLRPGDAAWWARTQPAAPPLHRDRGLTGCLMLWTGGIGASFWRIDQRFAIFVTTGHSGRSRRPGRNPTRPSPPSCPRWVGSSGRPRLPKTRIRGTGPPTKAERWPSHRSRSTFTSPSARARPTPTSRSTPAFSAGPARGSGISCAASGSSWASAPTRRCRVWRPWAAATGPAAASTSAVGRHLCFPHRMWPAPAASTPLGIAAGAEVTSRPTQAGLTR